MDEPKSCKYCGHPFYTVQLLHRDWMNSLFIIKCGRCSEGSFTPLKVDSSLLSTSELETHCSKVWDEMNSKVLDVKTQNERLKGIITEREQTIDLAMGEASTLANYLYKKHYANEPDAVGFELCDSVAGVISQIDNMVTALVKVTDAK